MNYRVSVRELAEFTARRGDLDLRFTPAPSAAEGIAGHRTVGARRALGYLREVPLEGRFERLEVRGRADGFDPAANRLEEIKTHRGNLTAQPENHRALHWAQARLYGWLLCQQRGLSELELALVYFDVASGRETPIVERRSAVWLGDFFAEQCRLFLAWADQELAHRQARDAELAALGFPFGEFRAGQRALAEAVYKALRTGTHLLAQAPTGIGKTLASLFPALKAMPGDGGLDKLFYLTAKTSGRQLALDALDQLGTRRLRVLELSARDSACEHPDKACHGQSCPLAAGFFDRLPAARAEAVASGCGDRQRLRELALAHGVCPYFLTQELAHWADLLVGDYNYYFDQSALLHALTQANGWRVALLADEAHNLPDRARAMYSAELDQRRFAAARSNAPAPLKRALERLNRPWNALNREQREDHQLDDALPGELLAALQQFAGAVSEYLDQQPSGLSAELQQLWFDAAAFSRLAEDFGPHSLFARQALPAPRRGAAPASILALRNLLPAAFLAPRFAAARATVLFSATLAPAPFYADLLGLPAPWTALEVDSPFDPQHLQVRVARQISTRYGDRERSLDALVALLAGQYAERPGNYLAFFSSFDYLERALGVFAARHPGIPCWRQTRQMDENARREFLARFTEGGCGIGFAVLGGAFGEGIDLPGERLYGAFIATLWLPQNNPANEQMRERLQACFGRGYDYTYLYPGLQKVVQAAGRVIRGPEDRGVVHLVDQRFAEPHIRRLLPRWWQIAD